MFAGGMARRRLAAIFAYRHALTESDLKRHKLYRDKPRLTVLITGSRGMIGSQLVAFLSTGGHHVLRIGRGAAGEGEIDISWDPELGALDAEALEGVDVVVSLAGASIAQR